MLPTRSEALPAAAFGIAKTRPAERAHALRELNAARWWRALNLGIDGQDRAAANEDDFDALFTAVALTRLAATGQLLESPFADDRCEGDILGVCALTERSSSDSSARSRPSPSPSPSPTSPRIDPTARPSFDCPIPDCAHTFNGSRGGWDAHVGSLRRHPRWRPELSDPEQRREAFRREFADRWSELSARSRSSQPTPFGETNPRRPPLRQVSTLISRPKMSR